MRAAHAPAGPPAHSLMATSWPTSPPCPPCQLPRSCKACQIATVLECRRACQCYPECQARSYLHPASPRSLHCAGWGSRGDSCAWCREYGAFRGESMQTPCRPTKMSAFLLSQVFGPTVSYSEEDRNTYTATGGLRQPHSFPPCLPIPPCRNSHKGNSLKGESISF